MDEVRSVEVVLTEPEVALIVAALRNWQIDFVHEDLEDAFISHFKHHRPLSKQGIDGICHRLNFDESQGSLRGLAINQR
jgi:hypothetical protein